MSGSAVSFCLLRVSGLGRQLPKLCWPAWLLGLLACLQSPPLQIWLLLCSALLLEAACFGQEKGVQPGARLRAGHLCFCESHMGQMCVPLLCPFSDLLKADLLQLSKHPGTAAVPALHLIQCQCGDAVWSVLGIQAVSAVLVTRVAAF